MQEELQTRIEDHNTVLEGIRKQANNASTRKAPTNQKDKTKG